MTIERKKKLFYAFVLESRKLPSHSPSFRLGRPEIPRESQLTALSPPLDDPERKTLTVTLSTWESIPGSAAREREFQRPDWVNFGKTKSGALKNMVTSGGDCFVLDEAHGTSPPAPREG